jgi:hypothetical protein
MWLRILHYEVDYDLYSDYSELEGMLGNTEIL